MGTHGKTGSLKRQSKRDGAHAILQTLSRQIQVAPREDGAIVCRLGTFKTGTIDFAIEPKVVLDAGLLAVQYAEKIKAQKEQAHAGNKTPTQPAGSV